MANKVVNYKKIRTDIINGKKRCIYMKPKGKREYVKSKGEFVLLSVHIKKMQKKMKIKGGYGYYDKDGIYTYTKDPISHKVKAKLYKVASYMKGLSGNTVKEYIPDSKLYSKKPSNFNERQQLNEAIDDDFTKRVNNASNIKANNRGLRHRENVMKLFSPQSNNRDSKFTAYADFVLPNHNSKNLTVVGYA